MLCSPHGLNAFPTTDDSYSTPTSSEQQNTELSCFNYFRSYFDLESPEKILRLHRSEHIAFLNQNLKGLSAAYESLDASQPWLLYWITHSLDLLGAYPLHLTSSIILRLKQCQHSDGGFGGGFGQLAHLATTYAAVNALVACGTEEAYAAIDRPGLYRFLLRMKTEDGSFHMHSGGEVDIRGCYCALSVARLTNMLTPELTAGVAAHITRCQTYEGGLGPFPGREAHGGYMFCGLAALGILGQYGAINMPNALDWVVKRQMCVEGGFQGRTNKLVDGCYSFWQGGCFPLFYEIFRTNCRELPKDTVEAAKDEEVSGAAEEEEEWETVSEDSDDGEGKIKQLRPKPKKSPVSSRNINDEGALFLSQHALQGYILVCCQDYRGGLRDKPGKTRDLYHTCYCLSGLAAAQFLPKPLTTLETTDGSGCDGQSDVVTGMPENMLLRPHPLHNVLATKCARALAYFRELPSPPLPAS
eukprot:GCRY01004426.1.p1 GENE.GCRY01004426.1~~GCRY01004426.1.p1  ORF type:complete len:471 (-),score=90.40 GCRY01004426.1:104-1516(-)